MDNRAVPGLGVGFVLIVIGAVLRWAVHVNTTGVNLHTIGIISLIVGILAVVISLAFSWPRYISSRRTTHVSGVGRGAVVDSVDRGVVVDEVHEV